MTKPFTKEALAEMRRIAEESEYCLGSEHLNSHSGCDAQYVLIAVLDSHALVYEALDLATAKLATAKVCAQCDGIGGSQKFGSSGDSFVKCDACTNGVQFSDERARELLERLQRADWLISEGASIQTDGKQFWVRWEFKENGMSGPPRESIDDAIRAAQNKL